jgi:hypothetical protein
LIARAGNAWPTELVIIHLGGGCVHMTPPRSGAALLAISGNRELPD